LTLWLTIVAGHHDKMTRGAIQNEPTGNPAREKLFTSLQGGRAIAALLVVLYHSAGSIFASDKYWGEDPSNHFFDFGHAGVEFFFVLSGFIIFYVHRSDLNHPDLFVPYLRKRLLRIHPIYWLILTTIIGVYFLVPSLGNGFERDFLVMLSSFLLVHLDTGHSVLLVSWTLYHEVLFYFLFSLAILNLRFGLAILFIWLLASILLLPVEPPLNEKEFIRSAMDFYLSPLHLLFAMGIGACWLFCSKKITAPLFFGLFGVLMFLVTGMEENYAHWLPGNLSNLAYGSASTLALLGFLELERQGRLSVPPILKLIGDASYVIYLTHFTLLSLLAKLSIGLGAKNIPILVVFLVLPTLAVAIGVCIHWFIERPMLHRLTRSRPQVTLRSSTPYRSRLLAGGKKNRRAPSARSTRESARPLSRLTPDQANTE
jgi:peptidoglycan/LPS O-acetylase OafA/YrhL